MRSKNCDMQLVSNDVITYNYALCSLDGDTELNQTGKKGKKTTAKKSAAGKKT